MIGMAKEGHEEETYSKARIYSRAAGEMATEPGRTAGQLGSDHAFSRLFPPTGERSDYPRFYPPDFSSTAGVRGNASFGPWLQGHRELSPVTRRA